jgi:hypothetical protein
MKRFVYQGNNIESKKPQVESSQGLKYQFQDFKFEDTNHKDTTTASYNYLHIPQREVAIRDAISGQTSLVKPPDIEIKNYSPYREK